MWKYCGQKKPDFATIPESGQESVWDYPRPPAMAQDNRLVEVYQGACRVRIVMWGSLAGKIGNEKHAVVLPSDAVEIAE